jgi:hypothetical protein
LRNPLRVFSVDRTCWSPQWGTGMHTRSMATWFVSLAFVACAAGPPSGLVALGERCSPTQACGPELVCFRTVCVPDTEAPLPPPPRAPPEPAPVVPYPTLVRVPVREVYATDAEVRAVLVAGEGLLVVEPTRVVRLDAEGVPVAVFEPGAEVWAIALEGQRLLVAGPEVLTVLTPELVSTATLASPASGPCSSLVVLSGDRVICRRGTETGTFLTLDVQTGLVLAESRGDDLGLAGADARLGTGDGVAEREARLAARQPRHRVALGRVRLRKASREQREEREQSTAGNRRSRPETPTETVGCRDEARPGPANATTQFVNVD